MEPFKNFFSLRLVELMAEQMSRHDAQFEKESFVASIQNELPQLELKARAQLIADRLHEYLPPSPAKRAKILKAVLHPEIRADLSGQSDEQGLRGWAILPLSLVLAQNGLSDFERSLRLLHAMTQRFTAEFAIRSFILHDPERSFATFKIWTKDPSLHVRRLVSEGTRPRLPWAMQLPALIKDPSPSLPLLEALRDDPEAYVRRSVANHLNDISKDHPDLVAQLIGKWLKGASSERRALLRHAARTLVKKGHGPTLGHFGYLPPRLAPATPKLDRDQVRMGEQLRFSLPLISVAKKTQNLVVDYVIHYQKANGTLAPKVFKGARLELPPGQTHHFERNHHFKEVTTRRHYPGPHALSLLINGHATEKAQFELSIARNIEPM